MKIKISFDPPEEDRAKKKDCTVIRLFKFFKILQEREFIQTRDLVKEFGVTLATAQNYVHALRDAGIIYRMSSKYRQRDKYALSEGYKRCR